MDLDLSDVLVRLLAAATAGGLVGLNRDLADKADRRKDARPCLPRGRHGRRRRHPGAGIAENPDALSRVVQEASWLESASSARA